MTTDTRPMDYDPLITIMRAGGQTWIAYGAIGEQENIMKLPTDMEDELIEVLREDEER